jgi:hypothetical protein
MDEYNKETEIKPESIRLYDFKPKRDGTEDQLEHQAKKRELEKYEQLQNKLTNYFDESIEWVKRAFKVYSSHSPHLECINEYLSKFDNRNDALEIMKTHLKDNYINNPEYKGWTFDLDEETLVIEIDDEEWRQEKARLEKEAFETRINGLNDYINGLKANRYKGTINIKESDRYDYDNYILPHRNDIEKVNEGQYKIIYEDKPDNNLNFEIEPNKPFYEDSEELKKPLKRFLTESSKVHINPDMFFIPFRYKKDDKFYILVINNILENIELYQLNSLNHLNKQHNLYYVIGTNADDAFKGKLDKFKDHVLTSCQKITNSNRDLLYEVYSRISHFKDDKLIVTQYH